MDFDIIIDSHTHWGPSLTMGIDVTTQELLRQQKESGVTHVVIIPFPSTAIASNKINVSLLEETKRIPHFIPYHYIRENYDDEDFNPLPSTYSGGKWHWMRGIQDSSSNYNILRDKALPGLVDKIRKTERPVIFEEELRFTEMFVHAFQDIILIIPHLGLLGGDPLDFLKTFKDNANVYFDTALASSDTILEFVNTVGPERVLFGSDIPFGTMKTELSKILSLPISDNDKESILFKNIIGLAHLII